MFFLLSLVKQHRHLTQCATEPFRVDLMKSKWTVLCAVFMCLLCVLCWYLLWPCSASSVGLFGHKTFYFSFCHLLLRPLPSSLSTIITAGIVILLHEVCGLSKGEASCATNIPSVLFFIIFIFNAQTQK